jgi:hypothetical protein
MNWAARNVRKYIVEGCELHGLHFVEVWPAYTSKQDSRTGAPGIRCEDVFRKVFDEAARRALVSGPAQTESATKSLTRHERDVRRWAREISNICRKSSEKEDLNLREQVILGVSAKMADVPTRRSTIRLPYRGGELFVSAAADSPLARGMQADLNAAANIGLKALFDPDWEGAWWFVLTNLATGEVVKEKVQGSAVWDGAAPILSPTPQEQEEATPASTTKGRRRRRSAKRGKTAVYAFNPLFGPDSSFDKWITTIPYWKAVERVVAARLVRDQTQAENPF